MEENSPLPPANLEPYPSIKQCVILFFLFIAFSIGGVIFALPFLFLGPDYMPLFLFVFYFIAFGSLSFTLYDLLKKREDYRPIQWKPVDMGTILLAIVGAVTMLIGISLPLVSLIPTPDFAKGAINNPLMGVHSVWILLCMVVLAPLFEEYICRGVILDGLLRRYPPRKAILISALFFAILHLNPWQGVSAFVLGCFTGWVYYRTQNLLYPIVIHFTNNGVALLNLFFYQSSGNSNTSLAETYGGPEQVIPVILAAIAIFAGCIRFLDLRMPKPVPEEMTSEPLEETSEPVENL